MSLLEGPPCPGVALWLWLLHSELWCQRELLQHWKRRTASAAPAQLLAEVLKVHHLEGAEALLWELQFMQMICPTQLCLEPPTAECTHGRHQAEEPSCHPQEGRAREQRQRTPRAGPQLSCPSRPPTTVKRSNRSLHTLGVETLAKALGLHQQGAHLTLPAEWLLGASTGGPLFTYQTYLGSS